MLEIRLFGALRLAWQGRALPLSGLPKTGPLLAYLLLNRLHSVEREHLAFLLWPDAPEATAKANLRRHIYDLQNALPPSPAHTPWILRTARTLQWNPQAPYWLDVARFESLGETPEHLASAVDLYAGDLLAYLDEAWLVYERGRLAALFLGRLQALIEHHTAAGDYAQALECTQRILRGDPLHEEAFRESLKLRTYRPAADYPDRHRRRRQDTPGPDPQRCHQNQKIVFLSNAAERALLVEDYPISAILHGAMQSICQQVNMVWPPYYQREFAGYVATTRQHLEAEQFTRLWNLGARLSLVQAIQRVADWLGVEDQE